MSISDLKLVESIFKGGSLSKDKEQELYSELFFMVLSRATAADLNIETVEVEKVAEILSSHLDKEFSAQEIRVAALSRLYKLEPFDKYVSKLSKKITLEHRQDILQGLIEVFRSDGGVGVLEADFFNKVVGGLDLTPAQLIGLQSA